MSGRNANGEWNENESTCTSYDLCPMTYEQLSMNDGGRGSGTGSVGASTYHNHIDIEGHGPGTTGQRPPQGQTVRASAKASHTEHG